MKKKLVTIFLCFVSALCLCLGLTACNEEHSHRLVKMDGIEKTCTQSGRIPYWFCLYCGICFSDEGATNEIGIMDMTIPAEGHHFLDGECTVCHSKQFTFALSEDETYYICTGLETDTETQIVIPAVYNNLPVKSIGNGAFSGCRSLRGVIIPNSVIGIGRRAFSDCSSLTSISIPNSVTSIDSQAFSGCYSLTSISIPNSVTSIGSFAFSNCKLLTDITIPNSVTNIESGVFYCCHSLTGVVIPDSVTSIDSQAFSNCSLTGITIPNSVTHIGDSAFSACSSLTDITIPSSVTNIGSRVFQNCSSLTSIDVESGNTIYHSAGNCLIKTADKALIAGCKSSVIPTDGSVTSIGYDAFNDCTELTSITIPDSVTEIGERAFIDCSSLTELVIPSSVARIGRFAFSGCSGLTGITVENGNAIYHSVGNCLIETASQTLIFGCKTSTIPADGSVTSIGESAFSGCRGLTEVTIPNCVTKIANSAFSGCTALTEITIPDNVTNIGEYAFYGCRSLKTIMIGSGVRNIGDYAFNSCSSLSDITFQGTKENWNAIGKGLFWNFFTGDYKIHCEDGDIKKENLGGF